MSQVSGEAVRNIADGGERMGRESSSRKLIMASAICFAFMVFEILAGVYSGSLAIVTDAAHMLSDLCSFGISLVAIYLAKKPPTSALTFGYQRVEMLGAFLSIMMIWLLTLWLVVKAVTRIIHPTPVKAEIMIITGIFGFISNIILALILSDSHDGHHHHHHHHHAGHAHSELDEKQRLRYEETDGRLNDIKSRSGMPTTGESEEVKLSPKQSMETYALANSNSSSELSSTPLIPGNAMEGYKRAGEVLKRLGQHSAVGRACSDNLENVASAYIEIQDDHSDAEEDHHHRHHHHHHGGNQSRNVNVWAAYLHTLGDMVQNVGVILAGAVIYYKPTWWIADPICTIFFAVIVVYTTLGLIQEALMLLMEASPQNVSAERVGRSLRQISDVIDLHDLHIWSLALGTPALACHLVIGKDASADAVLERATHLVQEKFGVLHTTIQVDIARNKAACETDAHGSCRKNN